MSRRPWIIILALLAASLASAQDAPAPTRILVVDSYHHEYPWSAGIRRGIHEVLGVHAGDRDRARSADGQLEIWTEFMDTKRHPERDWAERAAQRVAGVVDSWHPDLVITCDDNAVRYLVLPHLLGRELPVVYCGVNWDASVYGLPSGNVTGMIEVDQTAEMVATLRSVAAGDRLGLLLLDSTSGRRDAEVLQNYFKLKPVIRLVGSYDEWKQAFVEMQDQVDVLLLKQNVTGLEEWSLDDAMAFTAANTRIPTGTTTEPVMRCTLVSYIKNPVEQGTWAARTAQAILAGMPPREIEPGVNRESRIFLNMDLARQLEIRFPMELMERATFLEERWSR